MAEKEIREQRNEHTNGKAKLALANPTKFGMAGIGVALAMLGFALAEVITLSSVVLATVLTMGFVAPIVAGILEYVKGNSFRATTLVLFSLFFLSFYLFMTRTFNTIAPTANSMGVFFIIWTVVNLLVMCGTMFKKMDIKMIMLHVILTLFALFTLMFAVAQFTGSNPVLITAGALALASALCILVDFIMHICERIKTEKKNKM